MLVPWAVPGSGVRAEPAPQEGVEVAARSDVSTIVVEHTDRLARFGHTQRHTTLTPAGTVLGELVDEDQPTHTGRQGREPPFPQPPVSGHTPLR